MHIKMFGIFFPPTSLSTIHKHTFVESVNLYPFINNIEKFSLVKQIYLENSKFSKILDTFIIYLQKLQNILKHLNSHMLINVYIYYSTNFSYMNYIILQNQIGLVQ
jgi:hypothetical protein